MPKGTVPPWIQETESTRSIFPPQIYSGESYMVSTANTFRLV